LMGCFQICSADGGKHKATGFVRIWPNIKQ
jgi:hypothetical protein